MPCLYVTGSGVVGSGIIGSGIIGSGVVGSGVTVRIVTVPIVFIAGDTGTGNRDTQTRVKTVMDCCPGYPVIVGWFGI